MKNNEPNNENSDFFAIPEGLEFREEYMQQALDMYEEAKKEKRKKRILFWFWRAGIIFTGISLGYLILQTTIIDRSKKETGIVKSRSKALKDDSPEKSHGKKELVFSTNERQHRATKRQSGKSSENLKNSSPTLFPKLKASSQPSDHTYNLSFIRDAYDSKKRNQTAPFTNIKAIETISSASANENEKYIAQKFSFPKDSGIVASNSVELTDSISSVNPENKETPKQIEDPISLQSFKKHGVYLSAGITMPFGYSVNSSFAKIRENLCLSYRYLTNGKIGLDASFSSFSIGKVSAYQTIEKSSSTELNVRTKSLQYLSLSGEMVYYLSSWYVVTSGFGFEMLLPTVSNELQKTSVNVLSQDGTNDSFRKVNNFLVIGNEITLRKSLSIVVSYQVGLSDVTKNTPLNNTKDKNSRLIVGIKYRFSGGDPMR